MPAYQIRYTREDMPEVCKGLKFAHTPEDALKLLLTGNAKKGYNLKRSGVRVKLLDIKEI